MRGLSRQLSTVIMLKCERSYEPYGITFYHTVKLAAMYCVAYKLQILLWRLFKVIGEQQYEKCNTICSQRSRKDLLAAVR